MVVVRGVVHLQQGLTRLLILVRILRGSKRNVPGEMLLITSHVTISRRAPALFDLLSIDQVVQGCFCPVEADLTHLNSGNFVLLDGQRGASVQRMVFQGISYVLIRLCGGVSMDEGRLGQLGVLVWVRVIGHQVLISVEVVLVA